MIKIKQHQHDKVRWFRCGYARFGKPQGFVNAFFVDGLLIDTAQVNVREEIVPIFQTLPIENIIVTHHHEDHSGNLPILQKKLNVPSYGHALMNTFLKKPKRVSYARRSTWGQMSAMQVSPLNLELPFKTVNHHFDIYHTPGHAADQISLHEPNEGWLFSGDVYVHDFLKYCLYDENFYELKASIELLLTLDFDVLFCSHNVQLKKPRRRLEAKLQFLEDFCGKVTHLHQKGLSNRAIMKQIGLKENWMLRLMANREVCAENMVEAVIRGIKK